MQQRTRLQGRRGFHYVSRLTRWRRRKRGKGVSIYDVRKIFGFLDPLPPVTVTNQLILFLSSAFWGPPPPPTADVIYGNPLTIACPQLVKRCNTKRLSKVQRGNSKNSFRVAKHVKAAMAATIQNRLCLRVRPCVVRRGKDRHIENRISTTEKFSVSN